MKLRPAITMYSHPLLFARRAAKLPHYHTRWHSAVAVLLLALLIATGIIGTLIITSPLVNAP